MPCREIGLPLRIIERCELAVIDRRIEPDPRNVRLAQEHAMKPVLLHFGHVTDQTVQ
jgi:hypothetical protein